MILSMRIMSMRVKRLTGYMGLLLLTLRTTKRESHSKETSPVRNTCRAPASTDTAATKMPIPSQQVTTTQKATSRGHVNEADHVHQGQHPSGKRNQACVDRRVARAAARCIRHPRKSAHGSRHPGEEVEILRLYCEWKVCFIISTYRHAK